MQNNLNLYYEGVVRGVIDSVCYYETEPLTPEAIEIITTILKERVMMDDATLYYWLNEWFDLNKKS